MSTTIDVSIGSAVVDMTVSIPTEQVELSATYGVVNVALDVSAGAPGNQGPQGPQGEVGPTDIYTTDDGTPPPSTQYLWLDEAATGNGTQGPQGPQGAPGTGSFTAGIGINIESTGSVGAQVISARSGFVRVAPSIVHTSIIDEWTSGTVTLTATPTVGNLLVAVWGAALQGPLAPATWTYDDTWTAITGGQGPNPSNNGNATWAICKFVTSGTTDVIDMGSVDFGGQSSLGSVLIVFELTNVDPTTPIAGSSFVTVSGGFPTSGIPTDAVPLSDANSFIIAAANFLGGGGNVLSVGDAASPDPGAVDLSLNSRLCQMGLYYCVATEGVETTAHIVAEIDDTSPYNVENAGATEILVVLNGEPVPIPSPLVSTLTAGTGIYLTGTSQDPIVNASGVASVSAGTGITITGTSQDPIVNASGVASVSAGTGVTITGSATSPVINTVGDSRLMLSMRVPNTPLPNGTWITVGQDTAAWSPQTTYNYQAGSDLSLNADGMTIDVATTGTYMVRLAFQYTSYQGSTQVRFATGASAVATNFPGWICGDPDPLTIAVALDQSGDYIGNYLWRIEAGGSFTIALSTWGNTAPESLDGVEMDIVRVA